MLEFLFRMAIKHTSKARGIVEKILSHADIAINGSRPWDIQIHNERFFPRVLTGGSLAFGESYMDGWWDAASLDEFFTRVLGADLDQKIKKFLHDRLVTDKIEIELKEFLIQK